MSTKRLLLAVLFWGWFLDPCAAELRAGDIVLNEPTFLGEVLRVDPLTGAMSHLSSGGLLMFSQRGIAVENRASVITLTSGGVVRIDANTGSQSLVSSLSGLVGIAIDSSGDLLLTRFGQSGAPPSLLRMDPGTGQWTTITSGGLLNQPYNVAVGQDGTIFVSDAKAFGGAGGLIRVDPLTGDQIPLASGGFFVSPADLAIGTDGFIYVADANAFGGDCPNRGCGGIIRIDPATGAQTVASMGGYFENPVFMAVEPSGKLLVSDWHVFGRTLPKLIRVDPAGGQQVLLSTDSPGPGDLAIVPGTPETPEPVCGDRIVNRPEEQCDATDGGSCDGPCASDCTCFEGLSPGDLIVLDDGLRAVMRVDRQTGDRVILSSAKLGTGPWLNYPKGVAVRRDGDLFVADPFNGNLLQVDPSTGDRWIVSKSQVHLPHGTPFFIPIDLAIGVDGALLSLDVNYRDVLRVNEGTGDRIGVSVPPNNSLVPIGSPGSMDLDGSGEVFVTDRNNPALIAISLDSGARRIASGRIPGVFLPYVGSGPQPFNFNGLAIERDGNILATYDDFAGDSLLYRIQRASGDRSILSGCAFQYRMPCKPYAEGPDFHNAEDVAAAANGDIFVSDSSSDTIFHVDPESGDRSVVTSATRGRGPELLYPRSLTLVPADYDGDGDGIPDDGDLSGTVGDHPCGTGAFAACDDNCRRLANPSQENFDHDDAGDACDADDDDDGLADAAETGTGAYVSPDDAGTSPLDADTDDDGLEDGYEVAQGVDPNRADTDGDGLEDGSDVELIEAALWTLPSSAFKGGEGTRSAALNLVSAAEDAALRGNRAAAIRHLGTLVTRMDGCGDGPDGDDWISSCAAQALLSERIRLVAGNLAA